jgi:N-acetylneuraminate synthase/pseudaminic acid synthase
MEIRIGKHTLGPGHPTFIVAEMSGNHGGNLEKARAIVHAAKRVGADAIKLQTYTADTITIRSDKDDFKIPQTSAWAAHSTLWDLYNQAYTPWEWHQELFDEARKLGLEIFSSPFDTTAVDFLEQLEAPAYKIASPEITNIPLIEAVGRTGKPVIISTGVSTIDDVELALTTLRKNGCTSIVVLKCTTAYPAPVEESNLLTIPDMIKRLKVISGLSDHSIGNAAAIATVALGGSLIEKHFTLDNSEETVDSFFSAGEAQFAQMVKDIRFVEKALGKVSYEIAESAKPSIKARSSIYIAADIKAGEKLTTSNVKAVRPGLGLHPKYYKDILGRTAKFNLKLGDRLTWDALND